MFMLMNYRYSTPKLQTSNLQPPRSPCKYNDDFDRILNFFHRLNLFNTKGAGLKQIYFKFVK